MAPRCHRVTRRAGCQKATMELSLQNLQTLSHLRYPTDTYQLTSSQREADGVSEREYDIAGIGGGEFALRLVPRQRAAPFYRRTRTYTHTYKPVKPHWETLENLSKLINTTGKLWETNISLPTEGKQVEIQICLEFVIILSSSPIKHNDGVVFEQILFILDQPKA